MLSFIASIDQELLTIKYDSFSLLLVYYLMQTNIQSTNEQENRPLRSFLRAHDANIKRYESFIAFLVSYKESAL